MARFSRGGRRVLGGGEQGGAGWPLPGGISCMCGGFPDHCGDAGCHELLRRDASFDRHAIPPAEHGRLAALTYLHSMICYTEGIRATAPVKWRGLDGAVGVFWEAESQSGAHGYYLSPD